MVSGRYCERGGGAEKNLFDLVQTISNKTHFKISSVRIVSEGTLGIFCLTTFLLTHGKNLREVFPQILLCEQKKSDKSKSLPLGRDLDFPGKRFDTLSEI